MKVYAKIGDTTNVLCCDELWALVGTLTAEREAAEYSETMAALVVAELKDIGRLLGSKTEYWCK